MVTDHHLLDYPFRSGLLGEFLAVLDGYWDSLHCDDRIQSIFVRSCPSMHLLWSGDRKMCAATVFCYALGVILVLSKFANVSM